MSPHRASCTCKLPAQRTASETSQLLSSVLTVCWIRETSQAWHLPQSCRGTGQCGARLPSRGQTSASSGQVPSRERTCRLAPVGQTQSLLCDRSYLRLPHAMLNQDSLPHPIPAVMSHPRLFHPGFNCRLISPDPFAERTHRPDNAQPDALPWHGNMILLYLEARA